MDGKYENISGGKRIYVSMDEAEVFRTVNRMMRRDRVFLDPWLTVESLAVRIGVHRNVVSHAVNLYTGENFAAYLARFRVDEAERLVALSAGVKIKMAELARQAGFSNHSSFYRAVRAIRGGTPSAVFNKQRYGKRQSK